MKSSALYPGTFDPFTRGHEDIVRRAARIFEWVVVAVASHTTKTPAFAVEERVELARGTLAGIANVEVVGYTGLTVEFARERSLSIVVRGLRAVSDFEFEFQLANMSRHLLPEVETIFMVPTENFTFISSTLVREIASLGGDVSSFVHPTVEAALKRRYRKG